MNRLKMAVGMVVGAVLLHVLAVACSSNGGSGTVIPLLDTGVMGGRDAQAQTTCAAWEVKYVFEGTTTVQRIEAGWDPFAVAVAPNGVRAVALRRCAQ